jgi:hypothetical protein
MEKDTIVIKAPKGTKTQWVRQSQAESKKLSDWVIDAVREKIEREKEAKPRVNT